MASPALRMQGASLDTHPSKLHSQKGITDPHWTSICLGAPWLERWQKET